MGGMPQRACVCWVVLGRRASLNLVRLAIFWECRTRVHLHFVVHLNRQPRVSLGSQSSIASSQCLRAPSRGTVPVIGVSSVPAVSWPGEGAVPYPLPTAAARERAKSAQSLHLGVL